MAKKLLKNSVYYLFASVLPAAVNLLIIPYYLTHISIKEFGYLSIVTVFTTLLCLFQSAQLHTSINRFYLIYSRTKNLQKTYISSLLVVTIVISSIIGFIVYNIGDIVKNLFELHSFSDSMLLISVLISSAIVLRNFLEAITRAKQKGFHVLISQSINLVILISVVVYMLSFLSQGLVGILIAMCLANLGSVVYYFLVNRKNFTFGFSLKTLKRPLKFSLWMFPNDVLKNIYVMSDRILLAKLASIELVGVYAILDKVANVVKLITSNFGKALTPYYMQERQNNNSIQMAALIKITNYCFLAISISLTFIAPLILEIVYDEAKKYVYIISILSLSFVFKGLESYFASVLMYKKETKKIFYASVVSASVNIVLNIIYIPEYGLLAAALSTLVSYVISFSLIFFSARTEVNIPKALYLPVVFDFLFALAILALIIYFGITIGIIAIAAFFIYGFVTKRLSFIVEMIGRNFQFKGLKLI